LREGSGSQLPALLETERLQLAELAARSDLLLIAVSDTAIEEVARQVSASAPPLFHASGALPAAILQRADAFSLHPLKSLPPPGSESTLADALLVFEGPSAMRETARAVAELAHARFAEIDAANKSRYHAGAVFASNYVAALLDAATQLMAASGLEGATVRGDLARLAGSAISNWLAWNDARRFTGPAARGDEATIARHLESLAGDPELAALYRELAERIQQAVRVPAP
jgi:predicted short-subunit dehydrogenase-like oxidoreductase (DUF2520 family)